MKGAIQKKVIVGSVSIENLPPTDMPPTINRENIIKISTEHIMLIIPNPDRRVSIKAEEITEIAVTIGGSTHENNPNRTHIAEPPRAPATMRPAAIKVDERTQNPPNTPKMALLGRFSSDNQILSLISLLLIIISL